MLLLHNKQPLQLAAAEFLILIRPPILLHITKA